MQQLGNGDILQRKPSHVQTTLGPMPVSSIGVSNTLLEDGALERRMEDGDRGDGKGEGTEDTVTR